LTTTWDESSVRRRRQRLFATDEWPLRRNHVSIAVTQSAMDRYFAAMNAEEDFSEFFEEGVTWLMVDSGQEVRGPEAVRNYIMELHSRMLSGDQGELVLADGHAFLEGNGVNAAENGGPGLSYCLVYDLRDDRISAMRCYGNLAHLMPAVEGG
jgi:hypothetical protein